MPPSAPSPETAGRRAGLAALRALASAALLLPTLVLGLFAWSSWRQEGRAAAERQERALDLLHEHGSRVFDTYELLASYADELVRDLSVAEIRAQEAAVSARLRRFKEALPQVQDIWIVGPGGEGLVAVNVFPMPPGLDLSDRNYFRALRDGAPLYVSEVLRGRAQPNATFFQLARRLSPGPGGAFRGVIAVSIQPAYFVEHYERVRALGLSSAALLREDAVVLARFPTYGQVVPQLPRTAPFAAAVAEAPVRGTYRGASADGENRPVRVAYRRLPDHPVYVAVGLAEEAVRAAWLQGLLLPFGIGIPAAFGLFALARVALAHSRREGTALAALREETQRAETAEEARRRADARYRAYFENTSEGLFVIAVRGPGRFALEELSPANERLSGLSSAAVAGRELHEVLPAHVADRLAARFQACVDARAPIQYADELALEAGKRWYESSLAPLMDAEGRVTHLIGASRDVTERRALEERLNRSQKLEALGQLSAGVAHDFNNILQVVVGNLDMLKRAPEERRPLLIGNALLAAEQARRITGQLLAFGRRQALRPEVAELNGLVLGMEDMLAQSLRGDIRLRLHPAAAPAPVELDVAQFQTALINLAANARDAMPQGGTLAIEVASHPDGVSVHVADTGTGMEHAVLSRLGEPFFTTKREAGRGNGLGLAQVFGFVHQSGGRVEVESAPGRGTRITLHFPRAAGAPAPRPAPAAVAEARPRALLLVEDTPAVAEATAGLLESRGHRVTLAADADAALDALEEGRFDAVLSDLVMPGSRDGLALAREIRRRHPDLPVILMTGYSEAAPAALREGFPVLEKPVAPELLLDALARAVA